MDNQILSKPKIYENDKKPYYGSVENNNNNNQKNQYGNINGNNINSIQDLNSYVTVSSNKPKIRDNYYSKDKEPYYGPVNNGPVFLNQPKEKILTPIEIRDLSDVIDSEENKKRLENEITNINNSYRKNSDDVYKRDNKPYYDPTVESKEERKNELKSALEQVKKDLVADQPEFTEENFRVRQKVQNYRNYNEENHNKYVQDNFWVDAKDGKYDSIIFYLRIFCIFLPFLMFF